LPHNEKRLLPVGWTAAAKQAEKLLELVYSFELQ
jgi:hypothetical protein